MEQEFQTKNSPYSVMDYNGLLMNLIHYIFYNMQAGGSGIEQAHNLRAALKPKYQIELNDFFTKLDTDYNAHVKKIEIQTKNSSLQSDRYKHRGRVNTIQREYARVLVTEVIAILDRHGALEFTQTILQGGKDFQKVMGL